MDTSGTMNIEKEIGEIRGLFGNKSLKEMTNKERLAVITYVEGLSSPIKYCLSR